LPGDALSRTKHRAGMFAADRRLWQLAAIA